MEIRKISKKELKDILENHKSWLEYNSRGVRANLSHTDLRSYNLRHTDLRGVNLQCTDLRGVNLQGANLQTADLQNANLQTTNLQYTNLQHVFLRGADLQNAKLRGAILHFTDLRNTNLYLADLQEASLRDADLKDADLRYANLRGVDLRGANLRDADMKHIQINHDTVGIHPATEGELIGWGKKNGVIVKLLIPAEAKRSCATSRKHRAEYAEVLEVEGQDKVTVKNYYGTTIYKPGAIVRCHEWDPDRWNECGGGIHFFLTREEAESY